MSDLRKVFLVLITILFVSVNWVSAQVSVIPHGFATSLDEGEDADYELIIVNDFEADVEFNIDYSLINDENDRRGGPARDDPGDILGRFAWQHAGEGSYKGGLAWDSENEWMWLTTYRPGWIGAVDPNDDFREAVESWQSDGQTPMGAAWLDGILYVVAWQNRFLGMWDVDGNNLGNFDLQFTPTGVSNTDELLLIMNDAGEHDIHVMSADGDEIAVINDYRQFVQGQPGNSRCLQWVENHREGQLWINSLRTIYQIRINDDWEAVELTQRFVFAGAQLWDGIGHDGENMWLGTVAQAEYLIFDDGVREFQMLTFDPEGGEIPGGDSIPINVFMTTEGIEPGVYNILITIEYGQETLEMSAVVTVNSESATVICSVIDADTEEVIEDVIIDLDQYLITRSTDEDGACEFENLPTGEYEFTFFATDYLLLAEQFQIDGEGDHDLNVELFHSECNLDRDEISAELAPDEEMQTEITISNDGNGPLTYVTDRRLLGDANADPWELRLDVPAGVITDDARVHGAVFVNDNFYASGANTGEPAIYVMNREQELVSHYPQLGEGRYGYKDLASDGEAIWGSGERMVYCFTPDGEEVTSFDSGISPCNNLAWDPDREILWVSGTTTDIAGFDRDGNQVAEIDRLEYRIYGLAYWPDDPDGYQLYIFHKINEVGNLMVAKIDLENNQAIDVVILEPEGSGSAQGCFITNQYDIYSWVFMGMANSGAEDRIDIWQLDARKDWMSIEPVEGVIADGEEQEFTITLDASDLPQALFEGEILFTHDGVGGETTLPVSLQVGAGGGPENFVIELANGWNMVSAYVQPEPDDIIEIMVDLIEAGSLLMVKNGAGQFYNPQFNFNNIPGWIVSEGYMIKMDAADELTLTGDAVLWDTAIPLEVGWQMISYYPRNGIDAVAALSGIVDNLLMAKDGSGSFYSPAFGFSNMGDMIPRQGYLIKMNEAAELVYIAEEELAGQSSPYLTPRILPVHPNTGENMSLLVLSDVPEGEIGVYTNGNLVGSGVVQYGKCGIAVWGDDQATSQIDGALQGEVYSISLHDGNSLKNVNFEAIHGDNRYVSDGFDVIYIMDVNASPNQFGIVDVYPNPFNSNTSITYNLPEAAIVEVALFDIAGRQVSGLMLNYVQAGQHTFTLDGSDLSGGVYVLQLQANERAFKHKLTLIK
ncbi:MAG: T9SS type A sorting domain-containing protein [Calditrichaeota bacterium]|nr:T9SS type A sorting domain-containing protein [Calditrichota bacterium]